MRIIKHAEPNAEARPLMYPALLDRGEERERAYMLFRRLNFRSLITHVSVSAICNVVDGGSIMATCRGGLGVWRGRGLRTGRLSITR